tara:strand:+ start:24 stop:521 length:498 start_codon:yes stop_codon:yes gene_type:complete
MAATYEPIASVTASNAASVDFSSISGTYTDLVLQGYFYGASANSDPYLRFGNGSIDTGTNYSQTEVYGSGSAAGSGRQTSNDEIRIGWSTGIGSSASDPHFFRVSVMSYANTSVNKTVLVEGGRAGAGVLRAVGLWRSTSAITNVSITGAVNLYGVVSLYGIQAA